MSELAPPTKETYAGHAVMAADGVTPMLPAQLQAVQGEILPMPVSNPDALSPVPQFSYGPENGAVNTMEIATKRGRVRNFVGRLTSRRKGEGSVTAEIPEVGSETVSPWEAVPKEYNTGWDKKDVSSLSGLIERFRGDAAWNPDVTHTLKNAYSIVRNIGDDLLIKSDPTGEVSTFLDSTRAFARPRTFAEIERDDTQTLASHNEIHQRISIHNSNLLLDAKNLGTFLQEFGVELKNPSDTLLFTTINTAAHESGHAILSGASKALISTSSLDNPHNRLAYDERTVASRTYLAAHPEEAITGNWQTDVITHEERFAEGFGNAVLSKVMDSLGYNTQDQQTIISHFLDKAGLTDTIIGEHPIDMLDKFTADKGMKVVGQEVGVEMSAGAIGYSMPLTLEKMASQLSELARLIKSGPKEGYKTTVDPQEWEVSVKTGQSEETKAQIAAQRAQRATRVPK